MYLATPGLVPSYSFFGSIGIALVAASAAVVNHIADQHIDAQMARTEKRPVATGRQQSTGDGVRRHYRAHWHRRTLVLVNPLTAWLNFASWVGYGLVYTLYLKRCYAAEYCIGGLFGAAPPLFGWTAVTNSVDPGGLLLVLIIFAWTPAFLGLGLGA